VTRQRHSLFPREVRKPTTTGTAVPRAVVPVVVALLLTFAGATPALAHARLVGANPAESSVVATAPDVITLNFDGPVKEAFTTVRVSGPDGTFYSDGAASARDNDVRQQVKPLPSGEIRVTWRTVAADGAPLQGSYTFTNADPAGRTVSAGTTTATAGGTAATGPAASSSPGGDDEVWWLLVGGALVLALLGFGLVRKVRPRRRS
jgi:methionine-rich copper-binding protein CopC